MRIVLWCEAMDDNNAVKLINIIDYVERNLTINGTYTIDENAMEININGSVTVYNTIGGYLPYKFGIVTENFFATYQGLKSLKNVPRVVGQSLQLSNNRITDFNGCPEIKKWTNVDLSENKLESLKGFPVKECRILIVNKNNLKDLEGCPIVAQLDCSNNKLISLKGYKSEYAIHFNCSYNSNLESLEFAPKTAESFVCAYCGLTDEYIDFFPIEADYLDCSYNNLSIHPKTICNDCCQCTGNKFSHNSK